MIIYSDHEDQKYITQQAIQRLIDEGNSLDQIEQWMNNEKVGYEPLSNFDRDSVNCSATNKLLDEDSVASNRSCQYLQKCLDRFP